MRFLDWKVSSINKLINIKRKQVSELEDLKNKLIADTVTGQIDVRNVSIPDYEIVNEDTADATADSEDGTEGIEE